jgi:DNA-binding MarR family transcriptional regulator
MPKARKTRADDLTDADFQVLAEFRFTLRRFLHFSAEAAESAGLTPHQHQALLAIRGYPGRARVTVGELAERLLVRHHSAVGLVDRLEVLGLARRKNGTRDRRETFVALTPRGEAILRRLALTHRRELRKIAPIFTALVAQVGDGT